MANQSNPYSTCRHIDFIITSEGFLKNGTISTPTNIVVINKLQIFNQHGFILSWFTEIKLLCFYVDLLDSVESDLRIYVMIFV